MNPTPERGPRPAIFLDRDGTIIENVPYLADPARVRLLPGAAGALRRFRDAGYALVVVTNQSAIGRGTITLEQYHAVDAELARHLAAEGIATQGAYFCPEVPTSDDRTAITHDDRKPGPGMLIRGARDHGLDLANSWMIGDMISDARAGINAGCLGCLVVQTGHEPLAADVPDGAGYEVVADLMAAADRIVGARTGHHMTGTTTR